MTKQVGGDWRWVWSISTGRLFAFVT